MEDIILLGFGGHAKSVADCIERQGLYRIVGYTDTCKRESKYAYLGNDMVLPDLFNYGIKRIAFGLGYLGTGEMRQRLYHELKEIGFLFPVIKDPSAIVSENATIGEGTFIGKNVVVNAEANIGKMAIINSMALVEHECIVGDFVHVAVAAVLCGQVEVGEAAFVGANATVIQCQKVNARQIVPAGMVLRDEVK